MIVKIFFTFAKNKKIKEMKKLIYLIALAVLIAACGKDDETLNYIDNKLIGTWELEYYYYDKDCNNIDFNLMTDYTLVIPGTWKGKKHDSCTLVFDINKFKFYVHPNPYPGYSYNNNYNIVNDTINVNYKYIYDNTYCYDIAHADMGIVLYKIMDNQLLLAFKSNKHSYHTIHTIFGENGAHFPIVIYGIYTRKEE
jgi:hypothetical protein